MSHILSNYHDMKISALIIRKSVIKIFDITEYMSEKNLNKCSIIHLDYFQGHIGYDLNNLGYIKWPVVMIVMLLGHFQCDHND